MTLNFLGEVNADQTDAIIQELRYLRFPAFYLTAKGVGYFATGDAPHHLWVGVDAPKTLEELHDKVQNALRKAGVDKKDRFGFSPHISIARLRGTSMAEVFEFISHNNLPVKMTRENIMSSEPRSPSVWLKFKQLLFLKMSGTRQSPTHLLRPVLSPSAPFLTKHAPSYLPGFFLHALHRQPFF